MSRGLPAEVLCTSFMQDRVPIKVFITGTTGYFGFNVALAMCRAGDEVCGLLRRAEKASARRDVASCGYILRPSVDVVVPGGRRAQRQGGRVLFSLDLARVLSRIILAAPERSVVGARPVERWGVG